MDLATLGTKIKDFVNAKIAASLPSQTGNSGKYLMTNGSNLSWGAIILTEVPVALSTFTVDCSQGSFYVISMALTTGSFTLSNITANKVYTIIVKNTSSSNACLLTLPTSDKKPIASVYINPGACREFSFIQISGTNYWQLSDELS
jgi:hypothetical protein